MSQVLPVDFTRILEDDGAPAADLVDRYMAGAAMVRAAVQGMDREALVARPIAGKMSTLEVVGHLADADQFLADRMKRTIALDRPLLLGVDGETYLDALRYQHRDAELQVALIEATRDQLATDLRRLPGEAWERVAVHSEVGLITLRQQLLHAIRHVEAHCAAIAEKREALGL